MLLGDSLAIWISEATGGPVTPERLREHERVVRTALASATPLPLRFGSRFATEMEAIEVLDLRRAEFDAALARVEGKVEMGLRVAFPGGRDPDHPLGSSREGEDSTYGSTGRADALADRSASAADPQRTDHSTDEGREKTAQRDEIGGGREYLERRKAALVASDRARRNADETLASVAHFVAEPGFPHAYTVLLQGDLLGTVAHLVHRGDNRIYQQRIAELRRSRPDLRFEVSGPWAPYSFV